MTIAEAKKRMQSRRWGVFNHFLYGEPGSAMPGGPDLSDWNVRVDLFDADRVAKDLHDIGAGYYFITLMQGRKYMCAPNAAFDAIAGTKPGEACAKRDLILDLSDALAKYDIDLYLYYTGDGPYKDVEIGEKFGFLEPRKNVRMAFAEKWAAVLEEYAVRYGDRVKGWWIDGCYDYFGYDQELLTPYCNAVKKGNPSALVSMNNGVKEDLYRWYEKEDFTSGEFNDFTCIPGKTDVSPSVPHILAPLGVSSNGSPWGAWAKPGCKRDGKYMKEYIRQVNEAGGVVSVDIQIRYDSTYDPAQLACLAEVNG
ncbi:MAG: hypothetical protein IJB52_00515 [Clostridia bacterium]|nr:hypothetical protein [Clostridia bacterium]